eukprot:SAG22_NODE_1904_length_3336_cov_1.495521_1_plen_621_part_00
MKAPPRQRLRLRRLSCRLVALLSLGSACTFAQHNLPSATCTVGTQRDERARTQADEACEPCPPGRFDDDANDFIQTYETDAAVGGPLTPCIDCPRGRFMPFAGRIQCVACSPGRTWLNRAGSSDLAHGRNCLRCPPGTHDHDSDPLSPCQPCAAGRFSGAHGANGSQCSGQCPAGTGWLVSDGIGGAPPVRLNAITAASCERCPAGTTDHDNDPMNACEPCLAGRYSAAVGATGSCAGACPIGTQTSDFAAREDITGSFDERQAACKRLYPLGPGLAVVHSDAQMTLAKQACRVPRTNAKGALKPGVPALTPGDPIMEGTCLLGLRWKEPEGIWEWVDGRSLGANGRGGYHRWARTDPPGPRTDPRTAAFGSSWMNQWGGTESEWARSGIEWHDARGLETTLCATGRRHINDSDCVPCPAGSTDHDRNPGTTCQACPIASYPAAKSAGPCTSCPSGTMDRKLVAGLGGPLLARREDHEMPLCMPCADLHDRFSYFDRFERYDDDDDPRTPCVPGAAPFCGYTGTFCFFAMSIFCNLVINIGWAAFVATLYYRLRGSFCGEQIALKASCNIRGYQSVTFFGFPTLDKTAQLRLSKPGCTQDCSCVAARCRCLPRIADVTSC